MSRPLVPAKLASMALAHYNGALGPVEFKASLQVWAACATEKELDQLAQSIRAYLNSPQ